MAFYLCNNKSMKGTTKFDKTSESRPHQIPYMPSLEGYVDQFRFRINAMILIGIGH